MCATPTSFSITPTALRIGRRLAPTAIGIWTMSVSLQDLRIHRNEIHSKLVAIMRERLTTNLKQLPGTAAAWGTGAPGRKQPSAFAQTNAKQLRILCQASCNDSQTLLAFLLHCKQSCIKFVSHPQQQHRALLHGAELE